MWLGNSLRTSALSASLRLKFYRRDAESAEVRRDMLT
jgi:hypothetical protein